MVNFSMSLSDISIGTTIDLLLYVQFTDPYYRNSARISDNTIYRYSRLCNILLKQGRISPKLRAKTIDLLGSDVDKEQFFREFELFDHLRALYLSKGRYSDLFNICVLTGDLASAINAAISYDLGYTVEESSVETVFHYVMAETVFAHRGLIKMEVKQRGALLKPHKLPYLTRIASQWKKAFDFIGRFEDEGEPYNISPLEDGRVKDFLCLFVSVHFHLLELCFMLIFRRPLRSKDTRLLVRRSLLSLWMLLLRLGRSCRT